MPRVEDIPLELLSYVPPRLLSAAERCLKAIPQVRNRLARESDSLLAGLEGSLKPYRGRVPTHESLPEAGRPREEVLRELEELQAREDRRWKEGRVSGAVYHGEPEHVDFLNRVYALCSQSNPLHADVWPGAIRFEAEVVAMTASLLGAREASASAPAEQHVCGCVSSGGTESLFLAMKAYRDQARDRRGIARPEVVVPSSAHPAFDKAAHCLGMRLVRVPVGPDWRADVAATRQALTRNTIALAGSAPSFPHGVMDPIEELSSLARERGLGFHTDACLGGFVLPFAERLGCEVPPFDFRLPGVTSLSADTHKFGYAAKGTSVLLYRGAELRRYQYFTTTEWSGGIYTSPTLAGSRPGGLVAAAWASLVTLGEQGYLEATRRILEAAAALKRGLAEIPELYVLGDPLFVIAFGARGLDVYRVLEEMGRRGWSLNGLQKPPAVHLCVTLRHAQPGVVESFLADLRGSVEHVRTHPGERGTVAPVYGMAASVPFRGLLSDLLKRYMDLLYKV